MKLGVFTEADARLIADEYIRSRNRPRVGRIPTGRNNQRARVWLLLGKTDDEVQPGGTVTVSIWHKDVDSGEDIEDVVFNWMTGDEPISSGTEVLIMFDGFVWRIIGAECEPDDDPPFAEW